MKKAILNGYALNGYTVHSNLPIGAPMAWLSDNLPVGFLAFDGSEYNQSDYPELYNVVKNIPSFHSNTEGKFKIPNLKGRVLQGADTVIGELIEAGLPNITGDVGSTTNPYGDHKDPTGAFRKGSNTGVANQGNSPVQNIEFDASKSNPIYGNSDTVQMPAFTIRWIIKATQYATVEQNAIDDTKFTTGNVLSAQKTKELAEEVYSTEERVIGKWIDGKPLYQKTLYFPSYSLGGTILVPHNISNFKFSTKIEYFFSYAGYTYNQWDQMTIKKSNSEHLEFYSGSLNVTDFYITVEYTKTTD